MIVELADGSRQEKVEKPPAHIDELKQLIWELLDKAYECFGVFPTLLERDFNIPPVGELLDEVHKIRSIQSKWNPGGQAGEDHSGPVEDDRRKSA